MIRFLKILLAIVMPWLSLFIHDNPGGAFVALIMQTTIIGWPFASAWALRVQREHDAAKNKTKKTKETTENNKKA